MNLKDLDKIQKIYSQIKDLDKSIIQVEKMALKTAEGKARCKMTLAFDIQMDKEEKAKILDEDGSLAVVPKDTIYRSAMFSFSKIMETAGMPSETKSTEVIRDELTQGFAIEMMGVYLGYLNHYRTHLIKKLESFNVKL